MASKIAWFVFSHDRNCTYGFTLAGTYLFAKTGDVCFSSARMLNCADNLKTKMPLSRKPIPKNMKHKPLWVSEVSHLRIEAEWF